MIAVPVGGWLGSVRIVLGVDRLLEAGQRRREKLRHRDLGMARIFWRAFSAHAENLDRLTDTARIAKRRREPAAVQSARSCE